MTKYVGELGFILPPVAVIYDEKQADQEVLLRSIHLIFGSFINLKIIKECDLNHRKNQKYIDRQTEVIITTSISSLEKISKRKIIDGKTIIGFFNFTHEEIQKCENLDLTKFDRIVTVNDRTYSFLLNFAAQDKVRKVDLALDLRRFYALKCGNAPIEFQKIGMLIEETSSIESMLSVPVISRLLQNASSSLIFIQPKNLSNQTYERLKKAVANSLRNQIVILDPQYSIQQQVEFFKSIDVLYCQPDSLELDILRVEAEASGIALLKSEDQAIDRTSSKDFANLGKIHTNDFRILKFSYLRAFFGDGLEFRTSRHAVVIPADAGFFSVFNTLISIKAHWTGVHGFSKITPDWSIESVLDFWKTQELTSYCYASREEGNTFKSLFQHKGMELDNASIYTDKINSDEISKFKLRIHSPNLYADPDFTYVYADRLYRSAGFQNWRYEMHTALENLEPNQSLMNRINGLFRHVSDRDLVIGMHVRHPSHAMEQPNSEIPIAEDYIRVAKELLLERKKDFKKVYIFLATDQDAVVEEFRREIGSDLLFFEDVTRVTSQQTMDYENLDENRKLELGTQVQHMAAKDPQKWSSKLAEEIITDAWALARCQVLIHAVSNVATAVTFINPNLESLPIRRWDNYSSIKSRQYLASISSII